MWSLPWALIQHDWCPYRKRRSGLRHLQKEDHVKPQGEDGQLKAMERGAEGTNLADSLIMDFQAPEL